MEIRFFQLSETTQLQKAINEIWAENHIFTRDENLLKYMFYNNPARALAVTNGHYSFLGAWINNKPVGLLGIMPFVLNNQGKRDLGFCLTNWIVLPEYRTSGAGLALLNEVQKFKPDVILSLGINNDVSKLYKMMRWNVLEDCPRWIGIQKKERTIEEVLSGNPEPLRYWEEIKSVEVKPSYEIEIDQILDEQLWNEYYWNDFAKQSIGFARDYSFIAWRYLENPYFKYRVLTCKDRDGSYKGLAIVRVEQILDKEKIGRVVEFMATSQDCAVALANSLVDLDKDILFYDFYCFSSISSWGLESVGFKKVYKNIQDKYVLPSRFQPLDLEVTNLMASLYTSPQLRKKINLLNGDFWYVTKGDSDQDRPN